MSSSKFDKLWKLMSSHNFEVIDSSIEDLLCVLCQKLLIEPYSSMCGCHFCGACLRKYQSNGEQSCPGINEECKNVTLEIGRNVLMDFTTQFNVAKVYAKCAYDQCTQTSELATMEEHMRCCAMRPMSCPYQCLGCEDCGMLGNTVREHLQVDVFNHSKLLIEAFNNLKNDFHAFKDLNNIEKEELKCNIENVKVFYESENEIIKTKEEELIKVKEEMENIKEEKVSKSEFENVKKDYTEYKLEMEQFKKEFYTFKNTVNSAQKRKVSVGNDKDKLRDVSDDKISEIFKSVEEIKIEFEKIKETTNKLMKVDDFYNKNEKEVNLINDDTKKCKEEIKRMDLLLKQIAFTIKNDFVWTITSFSKKKLPFNSDSFTKYYYKFGFTLLLDGSSFRFELRLLKGELDDVIEWPMKSIFFFGIVNQESMTVHKTYKSSYNTVAGDKAVFSRPIGDCNNSFGGFTISPKELKSNPFLLMNDTLVLYCSVNVKIK